MNYNTSHIRATLQEENPDALLLDGFDEALVGIARRCGQPSLAVYDAGQCVRVLVYRDKITPEEALEFLEFNTFGAWVGEHTPVFLHQGSML